MQPLSYSVSDFLAMTGIKSRATVYKEISEGRLQSIKVGKRRLIPREAAEAWLQDRQREADAA